MHGAIYKPARRPEHGEFIFGEPWAAPEQKPPPSARLCCCVEFVWLRRVKPVPAKFVPLLIALAVVLLACLIQVLPRFFPGFDLFERLEWITYDKRVRLAFDVNASVATNLGAVFIDDDSLKAINRDYQVRYPWPRQLHGRPIT